MHDWWRRFRRTRAVRDVAVRLAARVATGDPLEIEALAVEGPEGIWNAIRDRYRAVSGERDLLAQALGKIPGDEATSALLELLAEVQGRDAEGLLDALDARGVLVPLRELRRLFDDPLAARRAVTVAGAAGYHELVPLLRERLHRPETSGAAAVALGRMRATSCTPEIVAMLAPIHDDVAYLELIEALQLMDDPAAIAPLLDWLPHAPDHRVYGVDVALRALTGRDPFVTVDPDDVRAAWAAIDVTAPPSPYLTDLRLLDPSRARVTLHDGAGLVVIDDDVCVAGARVYRTGPFCSTCETWMHHLGWPDERAMDLSATVRERLAHVSHLTEDLIGVLTPMLGVLSTGELMVALVDLDLEQVTADSASWFTRRYALRASGAEDHVVGPGTAHFQLRGRIPGREPTFCSVLPVQPLAGLDEATIARHASAIEAGRRPAALLVSWADQRFVSGSYPERFLLNVVLDGHHKLAAYARLGVPARALLVGRIADSSGSSEDDEPDVLQEMVDPLRQGGDSFTTGPS